MKSSLELQLIKKSFDFLLIIFCYCSQLSLINSEIVCLDSIILAPGEHLIINSSVIPLNHSECYLNITTEVNYKINITCSDGNVIKRCDTRVIESPTGDETIRDVASSMPLLATAKRITTGTISRLKDSTPSFCEITSYEAPNCTCGQTTRARIIAGEFAEDHEFISMAELLYDGVKICGGTIISSRVVMTAAHCVHGTRAQDFTVAVGTNLQNLINYIHAGKLYRIIEIFTPWLNKFNDIALLITEETIIFSSTVGAACLPFNINKSSLKGSSVIAAGWGGTEKGPEPVFLRKANFIIVELPFTEPSFKTILLYAPNNTIIYYGDSGGPVYYIENDRYYVVGVISKFKPHFALAANVNHYIDWIQNSVKWAEFCEM